jgi:gamma-glutamyl:cysteine ligase YbdK (ATP-grasp superfamily)
MERTLGVEREWFMMHDGRVVPRIDELLPRLYRFCEENNLPEELFGYELFAGQVEDRTRPEESVDGVMRALAENERVLRVVGAGIGLEFRCVEYLTEEELGELVVNGFSERHRRIWAEIPHARKVAASQVAAIHVHVRVTPEEAVRALNRCRRSVIDEFAAMGDFSGGKRLSAYRTMAETDGVPPEFSNTAELMAYIEKRGGERNVWDLVRYKPATGTIEFRMFGTTESGADIRRYVEKARLLVESVC